MSHSDLSECLCRWTMASRPPSRTRVLHVRGQCAGHHRAGACDSSQPSWLQVGAAQAVVERGTTAFLVWV